MNKLVLVWIISYIKYFIFNVKELNKELDVVTQANQDTDICIKYVNN